MQAAQHGRGKLICLHITWLCRCWLANARKAEVGRTEARLALHPPYQSTEVFTLSCPIDKNNFKRKFRQLLILETRLSTSGR